MITPDTLLAAARQRGVSALGIEPTVGRPYKILLASIVDAQDPAVQRSLVDLNREGAIALTRVDEDRCPGLVPKDRLELYQASRFWDLCCWFDCIEVDGAEMSEELS